MQIGRPTEIYRRPASRFVAGFIGQMNFLPATVLAHEGAAARVAVEGAEWPAENPSRLTGTALMAVRPEDIELGATPGVPARVEVRNFLCNLVEYKIRLTSGTAVRVQGASSVVYEEGASVTMGIHRGILFEA